MVLSSKEAAISTYSLRRSYFNQKLSTPPIATIWAKNNNYATV
jgi:hypothetical protein